MKESLLSIVRAWDRFFFAPVSMLPVALFRLFFSATLIVMYALRLSDWRFYFTDVGPVPAAKALEVLPDVMRPMFSWYPVSDLAVVSFHVVFLFALLLLFLGVFGRVAALVAFVLHLAFLQRNFTIVYGADIVATFFLFTLIFTDNSRHLSVMSLFRRAKRATPSALNELFSTVGVRLTQIQLCIIYGYTGLEKLKGPTWWDGTAVWAVLGNQQIMMFDSTWLKHVPLAIAAMTYSTVLWEVYFPALVWFKPIRKWVLVFGAILHLMIALTVGLFFFSLAMVSAYFVFVDSSWLQARVAEIKNRFA